MWIGEMRGDVCSLNRRIVEVVEIIDDRNSPIAFGHQTIDEVRADKACAASNENLFHFGVRRLDGALDRVSTARGSERIILPASDHSIPSLSLRVLTRGS